VLLLALAYIIVVGVIVGALAYWATNDLKNTTTFFTASQQAYAANAATETAIQSIRTSPEPSIPTSGLLLPKSTSYVTVTGTGPNANGNPYSPGECWTPSSGTTSLITQPLSMTVWCSTSEELGQSAGVNGTRVVTFYTCKSTVLTMAQCELAPLVKAVVAFDDYPFGGGAPLQNQCNIVPVVCGESDTEISWTSVNLTNS